jgi:hypothetical protein
MVSGESSGVLHGYLHRLQDVLGRIKHLADGRHTAEDRVALERLLSFLERDVATTSERAQQRVSRQPSARACLPPVRTRARR